MVTYMVSSGTLALETAGGMWGIYNLQGYAATRYYTAGNPYIGGGALFPSAMNMYALYGAGPTGVTAPSGGGSGK